MFEQEVKNLYNNILSDKNSSVNLKIQVLKNLQTYLQEEDTRMQQADRDCKWERGWWLPLQVVWTLKHLLRRVALLIS